MKFHLAYDKLLRIEKCIYEKIQIFFQYILSLHMFFTFSLKKYSNVSKFY